MFQDACSLLISLLLIIEEFMKHVVKITQLNPVKTYLYYNMTFCSFFPGFSYCIVQVDLADPCLLSASKR